MKKLTEIEIKSGLDRDCKILFMSGVNGTFDWLWDQGITVSKSIQLRAKKELEEIFDSLVELKNRGKC